VKRDAIRDEGLRELGANARLKKIAFDDRGHPRSYPERCKLMEKFKSDLKSEYREIALECHPDRNMDASEDVRRERGERFKRITRAVDFLMTIQPTPPRPPVRRMMPPPMAQPNARGGFVMVMNMGQGGIGIHDMRFGSSGTTTGAGFVDPNYWPWHG